MAVPRPDAVTDTYAVVVKAPPEKIFPLFCPAREELWMAGWKPGIYKVLKSESGYVEAGSEFEENSLVKFLLGKAEKSRWVTTLYDPDRFAQDFTIHLGDQAILLRQIRLSPAGEGKTRSSWSDTLTFQKDPPSPAGRLFLRAKLKIFSAWLGFMLKYYSERGKMLPVPAVLQGLLYRPL